MDPLNARPPRRGDELRTAAEAARESMILARLRHALDLWQPVNEADQTPALPLDRLAPPWLDNRRPHRYRGRWSGH
jgi:hypothetical protein